MPDLLVFRLLISVFVKHSEFFLAALLQG